MKTKKTPFKITHSRLVVGLSCFIIAIVVIFARSYDAKSTVTSKQSSLTQSGLQQITVTSTPDNSVQEQDEIYLPLVASSLNNPVETVSPIDSTWNKYRDSNAHFSIMYPSNWQAQGSSPELSSWTVLSDLIEISSPDFSASTTNLVSGGRISIMVGASSLFRPYSDNLEVVTQSLVSTGQSFEIADKLEIDGMQAQRNKFTGVLGKGDDSAMWTITFSKDDYSYLLICEAALPASNQVEQICDQMIATFRFE